jgi:hypothetical protein
MIKDFTRVNKKGRTYDYTFRTSILKSYSNGGPINPEDLFPPIPGTPTDSNDQYKIEPKLNIPTQTKSEPVKKTVWNKSSTSNKPFPSPNPETPKQVVSSDDRSNEVKELSQAYFDNVNNPNVKQQMAELGTLPLRYGANPLKMIGDATNKLLPNSAINDLFPNTQNDLLEQRRVQQNPFTLQRDKFKASLNDARDLGINALINAGTLELGFALPRNLITPNLIQLFKTGSAANLSADLLQLSKTDLDKLSQGDAEEIANTVLNGLGTVSKFNNFNASGLIYKFKNWSTISKTDKLDAIKDLYNLSHAVNQQTQRIDTTQ